MKNNFRGSSRLRRLFHAFALMALGGLLLTSPQRLSAQAQYTATVAVSSADGCCYSSLGINSSGDIVGTRLTIDASRAFVWHDGRITDPGTLGGCCAGAEALNASGQVVGWSTLGDAAGTGGPVRLAAVRWWNGVMTDLGLIGDASFPHAINQAGEIVGEVWTGAVSQAFLWRNGVLTNIGASDGGYSAALAINASGQVVGYRGLGDWGQNMRPFVWQDGTITELPTLSPDAAGMATAINDSGQIVGWSDSGFCYSDGSYYYDYHAVLWENGAIHDLGTLGCGHPTWALGINNAGQIVGAAAYCEDGCYWVSAFIYNDGVMTDLNTLLSPPAPSCSDGPSFICYFYSGFRVTAAWSINDLGQISAWSTDGGVRIDPLVFRRRP